jgi:hypothetical protein
MTLIYRAFFYYQVIWMSFEDIHLGFLTAKCLLFQVSMANFPISHYPCRTILDDAVRHVLRGRIPEGFSATLHISITLFICTCALATALVTSDLGTVRFLQRSYIWGICETYFRFCSSCSLFESLKWKAKIRLSYSPRWPLQMTYLCRCFRLSDLLEES